MRPFTVTFILPASSCATISPQCFLIVWRPPAPTLPWFTIFPGAILLLMHPPFLPYPISVRLLSDWALKVSTRCTEITRFGARRTDNLYRFLLPHFWHWDLLVLLNEWSHGTEMMGESIRFVLRAKCGTTGWRDAWKLSYSFLLLQETMILESRGANVSNPHERDKHWHWHLIYTWYSLMPASVCALLPPWVFYFFSTLVLPPAILCIWSPYNSAASRTPRHGWRPYHPLKVDLPSVITSDSQVDEICSDASSVFNWKVHM